MSKGGQGGENGASKRAVASLSELQSALLRNPNRKAIVEQLGKTPGLNKNQLRKKLGLLPNLLDFHLDRLEEHGLVVMKDSAQEKETLCFLRSDEELWSDEETRIMFGRRSTRDIGLFIAENPGAETEEIADAVGLSEVTVRHHLRTLKEHGMIQRVRLGRSFEYHPSDVLEVWNERVGECFARPWTDDAERPS